MKKQTKPKVAPPDPVVGKPAGVVGICDLDAETVLGSLGEGVIVADREGRFQYFNAAAQTILGIGLQNVSAGEWSSTYGCYYPDRITPFPSERLPLARALQGDEISGEIIYIKNPQRPEGVYIDVSARPIHDWDGRLTGGSVVLRDITATVKIEEAQRRSEERIKAQFSGIPIPTYVWQRQGDDFVLVDYNRAASRFTSGRIEAFLGKKFKEIFADEPDTREDFQRCHREKTTIRREKFTRLKTTGEWKNMIWDYSHVPPDLVVMHIQDVTERKKAEEELKKLSNAVEQTADSVIITDRSGRIEYVNPAFGDTTGYTKDEVMGKDPGLLKSGRHDPAFYENLWRTIRQGKTFRGTIINRKKTGELYWSEQTITPMKDDSGEVTHFVSVLKDITLLREKQEREFQMRIAQAVQRRLVKDAPSIPGFDIAGAIHSAVETSGDFFDIIPLSDGTLGLVIFDVIGHGIGSALIMAGTRAYLRALARTESDPGVLLTRLNRELIGDLDDEQYVTLALVRIDPRRFILDYASAGHVPVYHLRPSGVVAGVLESTGIPLGIQPDLEFETSGRLKFRSRDMLLFITDGILEAESARGESFGIGRTLATVKRRSSLPAREIVDHLYRAVRRFSQEGDQVDDLTALVCKMGPLSAEN